MYAMALKRCEQLDLSDLLDVLASRAPMGYHGFPKVDRWKELEARWEEQVPRVSRKTDFVVVQVPSRSTCRPVLFSPAS